MNDEEQSKIANKLYEELKKNNIEVLYDNRDERPGVKFKDMDLIGIPLRITVGKKIADNQIEFKERNNSEIKNIDIDSAVDTITKYVKDNLK